MDPQLKSKLKSQAHSLKPVIMIGSKGLTEAVHAEIERALGDHELMKVRVSAPDRDARSAMTNEILATHNADLVGSIGHIIIIYKPKPDPECQSR